MYLTATPVTETEIELKENCDVTPLGASSQGLLLSRGGKSRGSSFPYLGGSGFSPVMFGARSYFLLSLGVRGGGLSGWQLE